ncbi:uncharacterized protein LOC105196181 [Solenopsis invicta]|uniref:uncharacterized protein LOC105196181 n=1 Tax=Solenopsis invicta TaxID=13686 RepID=UPI00193D58CA|nr:uncharacterized protein LOC105196181 [Solenopsis invicta]
MKILLVTVALLIAIEAEAHPSWQTYPDFQNGRGNNPGRGTPWAYSQQYPQHAENQNNGFSSDVEWVCQNPRTRDIMIIASDNTRHTPQQYPGRGPWWQWHNVPPGHQMEHHHNHGNRWTQPIIIIQETPDSDKNQTPSPLPTTPNIPNNNDRQTTTQSPVYHGGEGSIDIRVGAN